MEIDKQYRISLTAQDIIFIRKIMDRLRNPNNPQYGTKPAENLSEEFSPSSSSDTIVWKLGAASSRGLDYIFDTAKEEGIIKENPIDKLIT